MATRNRPAKRVLVDVVEAGRKGGLKRRENLSDEELRLSAQKAIQARWDKYYAAHPEKLAAKQAREAAKRRASGQRAKGR